MSFGKLKLISPKKLDVELAPYIKDEVLSKRAKAMTEFKKYVK